TGLLAVADVLQECRQLGDGRGTGNISSHPGFSPGNNILLGLDYCQENDAYRRCCFADLPHSAGTAVKRSVEQKKVGVLPQGIIQGFIERGVVAKDSNTRIARKNL